MGFENVSTAQHSSNEKCFPDRSSKKRKNILLLKLIKNICF
jgi:hypothetical protein